MQASAFGSASFHVVIRVVLKAATEQNTNYKKVQEKRALWYRPPDSVLTHLFMVKFEYLFVFFIWQHGVFVAAFRIF